MPSYRGISEREVDRRIERLEADWGPFPVHSETAVNDPAYFDHGLAILEDGFIGGAAAWVHDDAGRVALIRHPEAPEEWALPGGGHEPGESLEETARREVREETGIECELTGIDRVIRKRFVHETEPARRAYLLTVVFVARRTGGELQLDPDRWEPSEEILAARWHASEPSVASEFIEALVADWDWPDD